MLCKARGHCKYRTICRSLLVINFFGHFTLVSFLFTKNAGNLLFGFLCLYGTGTYWVGTVLPTAPIF
jgi:hypothetical protein